MTHPLRRLFDHARRYRRDLAIASLFSGLSFVGTPKTIAGEMEERVVSRGSDGFKILFPFLPAGLDDFVDRVLPELQRRGLFRREYEVKTLRDQLGLTRPPDAFSR